MNGDLLNRIYFLLTVSNNLSEKDIRLKELIEVIKESSLILVNFTPKVKIELKNNKKDIIEIFFNTKQNYNVRINNGKIKGYSLNDIKKIF